MLTITFRGLDKLAADLEKAKKTAFPYAMRDAVNGAAFEARRIWGEEIRRTFTTRNTFTAGRALQVEKAKGGGRAGDIQAMVGSTAAFMAEQETGGTLQGKGAHLPIPGPVAAGQAAGGRRTRLVRAGNRLKVIRAANVRAAKTRRQRNAAAMAMARRTGKRFAVLERPKGGVGLFAISGGKRKVKARLVWDLSRKSARLPPHPTLGPTLQRMQSRMLPLYEAALLKQLQRHRVFGY
jgi:hypothetical protein